MIKNPVRFRSWEEERLRKEKADYARNMRLYEAMHKEARSLGIFQRLDPLEGLDLKIRLAKAINVQPASRKTRPRTRIKRH